MKSIPSVAQNRLFKFEQIWPQLNNTKCAKTWLRRVDKPVDGLIFTGYNMLEEFLLPITSTLVKADFTGCSSLGSLSLAYSDLSSLSTLTTLILDANAHSALSENYNKFNTVLSKPFCAV